MGKEKEVIEAEVVNEEETKTEEKKDNAFSRFFKNAKKSIDESVLEGKIKNAYTKNKGDITIYTKDQMISNSLSGDVINNEVIVFGKEEIKPYSVLIDDKDNKAYYVTGTKETMVTSTVDGVDYERTGTIIMLDENVTEVNVVKAGKRYFLYKGTDEEK